MQFATTVSIPLHLSLFTTVSAGADERLSSSESPYGKIVKEIRISELKWTKEHIITRELATRVGEPYVEKNVEEDLRRLDRLDLFNSYEVRPMLERDEVVLEVEVDETSPWLVYPSVGISDENGWSVGPGVRTLNLWGRDIRFGGSARFGGETSAGVFAENPWVAGNHFGYRVELGWRDRESVLNDFPGKFSPLLSRAQQLPRCEGSYRGRFDLESLESDEPGTTLSPDNKDIIPTLALVAGYDSRDLQSNAHEGWWNELEVAKTGGDTDYWAFTLDVRRYQPVRERQTIFFSSLVALRTGEREPDIPIYQDFRFGGTNSMRGWELNERAGKNEFLNTLEYRYDLFPLTKWRLFGLRGRTGLQLAVFGDAGILWSEGGEFALDNFIGGFGAGIRVLLPGVGMIRFDFGLGQPGASIQFHVGAFEKALAHRRRVR